MMTSRDEQYKRLSESRNRKPRVEFALWMMDVDGTWTFRMLFKTKEEAWHKGAEWLRLKLCREWDIHPKYYT